MQKTSVLYLQYLPEFDSYGIKKDVVAELDEQGVVAEILLPEDVQKKEILASEPVIGFLLGQDKSENNEEYYTIGKSYLQAILNTGANIRFLDYDNPYHQMKKCDGAILPGGVFNNPEDFYIDGKVLGDEIGKRYFAYRSVITAAHKDKKPLLGICAGAQMIGALLGNMKMYRDLKNEVLHPAMHKPREETDVRVHRIQLIKDTPIFDIMGIKPEECKITINSRHNQSMVHGVLQDYVVGEPKVKMDIYAISESDSIPEIWGNEKSGILCVQGHPEDLIVDAKMQNIYNYVVRKAREFKTRQNLAHFRKQKELY